MSPLAYAMIRQLGAPLDDAGLATAAKQLADALNVPPTSAAEAALVIADARAAMQHRWIVDGMNATEAKRRGQKFAELFERDHPIWS